MAYRKRIKLGKGFGLNLSGSGTSLSVGGKGFGWNFGRRSSFHIGIPGTGLSWRFYGGKRKYKDNITKLSQAHTGGDNNSCLVGCLGNMFSAVVVLLFTSMLAYLIKDIAADKSDNFVIFPQIVVLIAVGTQAVKAKESLFTKNISPNIIVYITSLILLVSLLTTSIDYENYVQPFSAAMLAIMLDYIIFLLLKRKYDLSKKKVIVILLSIFIPIFVLCCLFNPVYAPIVNAPSETSTIACDSVRHSNVKLKLVSKRTNEQTFDEWIIDNSLTKPLVYLSTRTGSNYVQPALPALYNKCDIDTLNVPSKVNGYRLHKAFISEGTNLLTYGHRTGRDVIVSISDSSYKKCQYIDLSEIAEKADSARSIEKKQGITWANVKNDILYVAYGRIASADSAHHHNANLYAISLSKKAVLWAANPQSCNSSFTIIGSSIVCGYGYEKEKSRLYVIDRFTGEQKQAINLSSCPLCIIPQGEKLFVWTTKNNYVFTIKL